jgi:hypothetical protein
VVTPPVDRDELIATLEESLHVQQRLVAAARDDGVPVADLVAQVTVLERLDDKRDELISRLRRTTSAGLRAAGSRPPIREVVLVALNDLGGWPQNAGFLTEYLWAARQLQLDSRAFAPLRRDERRSWERAPGTRGAYIAPALSPDGSANPRWLTSSAWPLERRVIASADSERLFDLQKVRALATTPACGIPVEALLQRWATQVLGVAPPPALPLQNVQWRLSTASLAAARIREIRQADDLRRARIACDLAGLPAGNRVWGLGVTPRST